MNLRTAYINDYFINKAYTTVRNWFKEKQSYVGDFESTLLNTTKVIWYELKDSQTSSIDIFTRINIGKIPLTNGELVKALFLQKKNFENKAILKQIQIAMEYYREKTTTGFLLTSIRKGIGI